MEAERRRVAAIVMPDLACEVARQRFVTLPQGSPLAVLLEREHAGELAASAVIDVVTESARRYGVRAGMKVTEAAALVAHLAVVRVTYPEIEAALGKIAEVALALAPTAAIQLSEGDEEERSVFGEAPFDTVWLDVTGAAHLVGGEDVLAEELRERAAAIGHRARVAVASGPRVAQAIARFSAGPATVVVAPGEDASAIAALPIQALPMDRDTVAWFARLGLFTAGDLARIPKAMLAARIPKKAPLVLDFLAGRDTMPLLPFSPPRVLVERTSFEDGVENTEALLFVLRGMTSRLAARLAARGEASTRIELELALDRSISALRGTEPSLSLDVDLPAPLSEAADLLRALKAKIERTELVAPAVALTVRIPQITKARRVQLDLSRNTAVNPDSLPALLAELSAEIGAERVGVLSRVDAHRPEARSILVAKDFGSESKCLALPFSPDGCEATRLLPSPVPLGRLGGRRVVAVDQGLYALEPMRFVLRLDGIEWWTEKPSSRDYMRAWITASGRAGEGKSVAGEALVYVDRRTEEGFLQGWFE